MRWLPWLLLCACGHSAQPAFFALSTRDGGARTDVSRVIEVRTPTLPGYLDRHELVLRVGTQLELARNAQWAEALPSMLARVLARDLAQRLPHAQVTIDSGHARTDPQLRIDLDVRRFDIEGGELVLDALVALRPPTGAPTLQTLVLRRQARATTDGLVEGMSELLGELAERIAAQM